MQSYGPISNDEWIKTGPEIVALLNLGVDLREAGSLSDGV